MYNKHRIFRIIDPTQHVLELKKFELTIEFAQVIRYFLSNILFVGFFCKLDERPSILCKRMKFVPGLYPIFSRIDFLENFLRGNIVVPETRLVGLRLKFF